MFTGLEVLEIVGIIVTSYVCYKTGWNQGANDIITELQSAGVIETDEEE